MRKNPLLSVYDKIGNIGGLGSLHSLGGLGSLHSLHSLHKMHNIGALGKKEKISLFAYSARAPPNNYWKNLAKWQRGN